MEGRQYTDEELEKIIYDPGVGNIAPGIIFRGWTTDPDYVPYDEEGNIVRGMDISKVREDVRTRVDALTDADGEVTYYAMLFRTYNVNYYDTDNVSLGTDEVSIRSDSGTDKVNYTVNMAYASPDASHDFEGWVVMSGQDNITGYPDNAETTIIDEETVHYYRNETQIEISGDVSFGVNLPEGHWLVFHEGKGGTYKAPQFIKLYGTEEETKTKDPGAMERQGYTFGGWFTEDKVDIAYQYDSAGNVIDYTVSLKDGVTEADKYVFGSGINDSTDLYAYWIPNTKATYTVLIWTQNINRDGYDFVESVTVENATPGSTPDVSHTGTGRDAYAVINGTSYNATTDPDHFRGFSYDHDDLGTKTVSVTGDTVVNVYYNRNQYTLTFRYNGASDYVYEPTTSNNTGQHYIDNGGQYQLIYLYRHDGRWYRNRSGSWITGYNYYNEYTGVVYDRVRGQQITAYYEENISRYFAEGADLYGFYWEPQNGEYFNHYTDGGQIVYYGMSIVEIMPWEDVSFNGSRNEYTRQRLNFYVEALDGETGDVEFNGKQFNLYTKTIADYRFITYEEDFIALTGYERYVAHITGTNKDGRDDNRYNIPNNGVVDVTLTAEEFKTNNRSPYFDGTADLYYTRAKYDITFLDGACYNGNNVIDTDNTPAHNEFPASKTVGKQLSYQEDISEFNYDPFNPDGYAGFKPTKEGYTFAGWYIDEACTTPYEFDTMPVNGVTVYAKWIRTQVRVFMNPNVPTTDASLNWGSGIQSMCFRVDYGGTVSAPFGTRKGYEFVGWFLDENFTKPFNASNYVLNDTNVKTPYDYKNTPTEPDSIYGTGYTDVKDAQRFWVTKRLDVYGNWRKVIDGADGIGLNT